jgi:lipoprotein-releasing system permease protein
MYKLHLILKYLRKRRIAWVSLLAVMLCTMMVLVVISIMGGWVRMFENSFHGLTGDVVVDGDSLVGFAHYDKMIERIEKLDCVVAAVPTIKTFGLINIGNRKTVGVQVVAFPIEKIGKVNEFPKSLYLGYNQYVERAKDKTAPLGEAERKELLARAEKAAANPSFEKPLGAEDYRRLTNWKQGRGRDPATWPGMIAGSGVVEIRKDAEGNVTGRGDHLYRLPVKLTVMPISPDFMSVDLKDKVERNYWIVDDSRTQVWQYDSNCIYVPFDALQQDLDFGPKTVTERDTGKEVTLPARCTDLQISVKDGFKDRAGLQEAKRQIAQVVEGVIRENPDPYDLEKPEVKTWRESQRLWLDAVEKEKLLTVFLFSIISVVAIFLIFCIFYMVVAEKTRDIGIIKSVGASAPGVAGIFLGYGLAIGVVGAGLGLLLSWLLVRNINEIHTAMGKFLGVQVWNPEIYLFDKIPNTMSPDEVSVIVSVAVVASVLGALVPAIRAARMNPVEAVRWE